MDGLDIITDFSGSKMLSIENMNFGACTLYKASFADHKSNTFLEGKLSKEVIKGDKSVPVKKIRFAIPNLRRMAGEVIRYNKIASNSRLLFNDNEYLLILDQVENFKSLHDSLDEMGGYINLYSGELTNKKGSIKHSDTLDYFDCFSTFISFLNGRRISPIFREGLTDDFVNWTDYGSNIIDSYIPTFSWVSFNSYKHFNNLWKKFREIWQKGNKDFLKDAIHWYIEANLNCINDNKQNAGSYNGSIVLAQTGLELIYNWLLVEQNKIIRGKDANGMLASNKIRLLISFLKISSEVPVKYEKLKELIKAEELGWDAPEAFVNVRNTIVHSNIGKRNLYTDEVKSQVLEVGIWYIELALLFLLEYKGYYANRCSGFTDKEEIVPWSSSEILQSK